MPRPRTSGAVLQSSLNLSDDHLDSDRVVSPAGHYHVGVALARLDELEMHRLHGREVLFDDFVERPPAQVGVSLDAPDEPDVRIRVDEDFHIAEVAHSLVDEKQNAVDDDHVGGLDACRLRPAEVRHEIVFGFVDRLAPAQRIKVGAKQVVVERVGMIPIELAALIEREGSEVLVVRVHVDERD
jgi:hypothetical protein